MYKVNDTVLYGNEGICQIENIIEKKLTNQSIEYYVLKPVYKDNATVYVPTQNQDLVKKMKKLLSYDEIMDLIQNMPDCPVDWIENDNQRKEKYRVIIRSGDHKQLIQMVKTLYHHKKSLEKTGKKFHVSDEKFMKEAENILYEEFAYVLNIKKEDVIPFICQCIEEKIS